MALALKPRHLPRYRDIAALLIKGGAMFARDRTTVAHACCRIEDLRDDPSFDRSLDLLEGVLRFLAPSNRHPA